MKKQNGAAILTAMLTVTLVAALSATALWQQWRGVEIEIAERERMQSAWILQGALDWARLILREDARAGATDHLAEPWAVPLQEARLSTFLAASQSDNSGGQGLEEAFLSGQIVDMQSRLNVLNLVQEGKPHAATVRAFSRLFDTLHLPPSELVRLTLGLQAALDNGAATDEVKPTSVQPRPLLPRNAGQLGWLGLSPATALALQPYVVVLPERTSVNLNTAPAEVLYASISGITMADVQRLVAARALAHFRGLPDVKQLLGSTDALQDTQHGVSSSFFDVSGQVRLGSRSVLEHSLVQRSGQRVIVVWRERGSGTAAPSLQ
jgi:general secretion pathway protein K